MDKLQRTKTKNEQGDTREEEEDEQEAIEPQNDAVGNWAYSKKQKRKRRKT